MEAFCKRDWLIILNKEQEFTKLFQLHLYSTTYQSISSSKKKKKPYPLL